MKLGINSLKALNPRRIKYTGKGNYAYVTARVKGKKRNLMTVDTYPKLMKMGTSQIARLLSEAAYHREMNELARQYSGNELVERALNRNLARTYREILDFSKGDLKRMLEAYLDWWNVYNIKVVLRGIHHGIPPEEVKEYIVPAGSLEKDFLDGLTECEDVNQAMDELEELGYRTPPLDCKDGLCELGIGLRMIEDYYDRSYYTALLDSVKGRSKPIKIYRDFIRRSIDVLNAKNLMELILEGFEPGTVGDYMIPGGNLLPEEKLIEIASLEPDAALAEIKKAMGTDLGGVEARTANQIAVQLDKHLMEYSSKLSYIYPLSIIPIIDFIIRKEKETKFIRIIVKGKEHSLPEGRIKELLAI